LIIGADNLIELNTWKNYKYLLENCYFIVYKRNELDISSHINKYFTNYSNKFIIKSQLDNVSSTLIRERIRNNLPINNYLNIKVADYIAKHNLYKGE
jgi:nicotinate-nucleotide adenylyltransferase